MLQFNKPLETPKAGAASQFSLYVGDSYLPLADVAGNGSSLLLRLATPTAS